MGLLHEEFVEGQFVQEGVDLLLEIGQEWGDGAAADGAVGAAVAVLGTVEDRGGFPLGGQDDVVDGDLFQSVFDAETSLGAPVGFEDVLFGQIVEDLGQEALGDAELPGELFGTDGVVRLADFVQGEQSILTCTCQQHLLCHTFVLIQSILLEFGPLVNPSRLPYPS